MTVQEESFLSLPTGAGFPEGCATATSDKCKNSARGGALSPATAASTSGFDQHADGGAESDRANRATRQLLQGIITPFSESNERKGSAPRLTAGSRNKDTGASAGFHGESAHFALPPSLRCSISRRRVDGFHCSCHRFVF